jgi:hypothetical protein
MSVVQMTRRLRALCYEHHAEMRLSQVPGKNKRVETRTLAYRCTEPDCLVHYDASRGYFVLSQNANTSELDMVPEVKCVRDGMPMYLAETNPEKKGFRLWRCPQCNGVRTNEEGLVGLTSQEIPLKTVPGSVGTARSTFPVVPKVPTR